MKVKICGITSEEAAFAASENGADLLGFVFANSTREITPERAGEIIKKLPKHVKTTGVFVNETYENIMRIARIADLDYIQLHGDESPEFCRKISLPVIKAFSINDKDDLNTLRNYECAYYLLDSPGLKFRGGSGIPFDWSLLTDQTIPRGKVILAGGLNEGNVAEAIAKVQPACVDVSSGVETEGKKDIEKITAFIMKAKNEESGKVGSLYST
ncbi:phosphoribosylanthranilate isomerase [Lederbergia lenta]|uniref:N-(5'-phosphoribosyl)anthranilate isomerase n=1 Tax=Lederbergia lenta TaxID=1467 RepID=A0A2X4VM46_LEDLE|nr:phosphoribosylanthranilate isomerase [Lederbergia lenta]MCM3112308.1 phosphoribosylanthranilate isomerase [Lederbergia lenta]MEC2326528.1 phosphoribosylanthranilate isomerase [Lederbergia lenta]SQI53227.1 N-(5'-phosphoribosyl)anthranilate isomerase [Lederbergia lenta]